MSVRISVINNSVYELITHCWWDNFRDAIANKQIEEEYSRPVNLIINDVLALWNGRDVPYTDLIEFDSEKDLAMFLLKWS